MLNFVVPFVGVDGIPNYPPPFGGSAVIMADTAAENEADSGSGVAATQATPDETAQEEDGEQNEAEKVTGSNTNYDSGDGNHKCTRCDFEGSNQAALTAHLTQAHSTNEVEMEVENNNPPPDRVHRKMFECDVCNMKFSNGANMRRHKMRHTGVKPYECRVCQKRFSEKIILLSILQHIPKLYLITAQFAIEVSRDK
ncbi:hypothetical protein NQ317_016878 [Molorchus minor]|uniref:C2H2-type domain-containing protein n=1 Tax=Molorchus minor TaxID=1323400 RepID=A0ABQ9J6T8_9CUCU|nr:hypothetical protein NQ317_016878 [Molorchus minor]